MSAQGISDILAMPANKKQTVIPWLGYHLRAGIALTVLILTALLIYFPGLSGPYVLDDGENIVNNKSVAIGEINVISLKHAVQSNDSGPFRRPLASLSFALNHYYSGGFDNTFPFKLTNLIIHTTNAVLLLFLVLKILRISEAGQRFTSTEQLNVAALTAVLWIAHPIQLTNVLYVVQRMNSLSAFFVILGLVIFLQGRQELDVSAHKGLLKMTVGVLFGTLLGIGSKENAILLPLFALTIEYSFFKRDTLDSRARLQLQTFYVAFIALPLAVFLAYVCVNPEFLLGAYKARHFSMIERVLTESRVLWHYIGFIVIPDTHNLGLFHDDIQISRGLLTPPSTLLAICGLIFLLLIAIAKKKYIPVVSFAILWFLAGHMLESSLFGLEVAYEHRNYLPSFGILFAISYFYIWTSRYWKIQLRLVITASIVLTLGFATWSRANTWNNIYSIAESNAANHPTSPRANEFAARVNAIEKGDLVSAIRYITQALNSAPDEVGFHIDLRLFLAMLSSQIKQEITSVDIKNMRDAGLQINGLPTGIIARINNNQIQLDYPPSSDEIIEKLLITKPITIHTLASLVGLGRCAIDDPKMCKRVAKQTLKWHIIAGDNPLVAKADNALILNNTAELHAHFSDYAKALACIDRATGSLPDVLFYKLKKIGYLIKLGNLEEARILLSNLNPIDSENDIRFFNNRELIQSVQDIYAEAVKARSLDASARGKH